MRANLHTRCMHCPHLSPFQGTHIIVCAITQRLLPCENRWILFQESGYHEECRRKMPTVEQGKRKLIVIEVAVIERDRDYRSCPTRSQGGSPYLCQWNNIAFLGEPIEVVAEGGGACRCEQL